MAKHVGSVLRSKLSEDRQKTPNYRYCMDDKGCFLQDSAPSAVLKGGLFYHVIMN